jgi:hypothetical protein
VAFITVLLAFCMRGISIEPDDSAEHQNAVCSTPVTIFATFHARDARFASRARQLKRSMHEPCHSLLLSQPGACGVGGPSLETPIT